MARPSYLTQLTVPQWLQLEMPVRMKLKSIFSIPRSEGTTVHNNVVISDGHTHEDLSRISVSAMQGFLGSKSEDFTELYNATLDKVYLEYQQELEEREKEQKKERARMEKKSLTLQIAQSIREEDYDVDQDEEVETVIEKPARKNAKKA